MEEWKTCFITSACFPEFCPLSSEVFSAVLFHSHTAPLPVLLNSLLIDTIFSPFPVLLSFSLTAMWPVPLSLFYLHLLLHLPIPSSFFAQCCFEFCRWCQILDAWCSHKILAGKELVQTSMLPFLIHIYLLFMKSQKICWKFSFRLAFAEVWIHGVGPPISVIYMTRILGIFHWNK